MPTPLVYDSVPCVAVWCDIRIPGPCNPRVVVRVKLRNLEMPKLGAINYDSGPTTLAYDVRDSVACVAVWCGREKGVSLRMERGT